MPRASGDKTYTNFSNGFITEATGLTFPENSLRDVDNCDLELDGTAKRRLGLDQETNGVAIRGGELTAGMFPSALSGPKSLVCGSTGDPLDIEPIPAEYAISAHVWPNAGSNPGVNLIVFQMGNRLYIRNHDGSPISSSLSMASIVFGGSPDFSIDSPSGGIVYNTTRWVAAKTKLTSVSGLGKLWFASPAILPFYIDYNSVTKSLELRPVGYDASRTEFLNGRLAIRDFNGVPDGLRNDEEPIALTLLHQYNLRNQGWKQQAWEKYFDDYDRYPSNAKQWFQGQNANGDFDSETWVKAECGNSLAPKGSSIIDALSGNKNNTFPARPYQFVNTTAGVNLGSDIYNEPAAKSFSSVNFFAGRIWLAGDQNSKRPNGVYFSKTIRQTKDAGVFMSDNDPTSEEFPDVLDTDGGVIYIPEAGTIKKLVAYASGLLVFAENGVWYIYGGEGGFTATNFSIEKVSSVGVLSGDSIVQSDQFVAYWAYNSIHALALPAQGSLPTLTDLAGPKIFSYYATISKAAKDSAEGTYDQISKKIFWSFLIDTPTLNEGPQWFNRMLVLDTRTGAFTKYSFDINVSPVYANSVTFPSRTPVPPAVQTGPATFEEGSLEESVINSLCVIGLDYGNQCMRVMRFKDQTFIDYRTASIAFDYTYDYPSYLITGDEILEAPDRNKQATYVTSFFKRTEEKFYDTPTGLQVVNPSGCSVQGRWDWHNTSAGGRWNMPQLAYRYKRPYAPPGAGALYNNGEEILYTKLKMRGKGHSLSLRYESVSRKDFRLLGYTVKFTADGV